MKQNKKCTAEQLYTGIGQISDMWILQADDPKVLRQAAADAQLKNKNKHFIGYEIKKLFGVRYLWIFLVILLLLNSGIAWYTAGRASWEPADMISQFFTDYLADPETYDAYYAKRKAFNEEQTRLVTEAILMGDYDYERQYMPDIYSTNESYSDEMLFEQLYDAIEASEGYPGTIQKVIDNARANLAEFGAMGVTEDSFTYKYQSRVISLYELARDSIEVQMEYVRGWDTYFNYDIVNILLTILVIMLGTLIFAQEKQSGFMPIIRTAKHGRLRTAVAKILTMLILTSVFVLLFTFSTWAIYGLRIGFSSMDNAIQVLPTFTLSPYQLSIGEYFLITVGVRLLSFAVFSVIILAFSTLFYNYILIYMAGMGFYGLNYLLYSLRYINGNNPLKNLNLVATEAVNPLFVRYRAVNLFNAVAGYVPFMLCVFSILLIGCSVLTAWMYVRGVKEVRPLWLDNAVSAVMTQKARVTAALQARLARRTKIHRARRYSLSLVAAETFKTLISSRFIFVVILLLCLKVSYAADTYAATKSYSDAVYKEYMITLEGPLTEEKMAYLAAERASISEVMGKQEQMQQAYIAREITFQEYNEYLDDYNYAYSRSDLLREIEDHASYLQKQKAKTGIDGWFMYDTGWKKLYTGDADLFLYTSILLLLTGTFASEYISKSSSGGFAQILRSTRNGREKTFSAKLLSAGLISVVLAVLMASIDIITVFTEYDMPAFRAPLLSMQMFSTVLSGISVTGYLLVFIVLRIVGALLMAMLVCALSELLCRYIPVLGSTVILTLLPALCTSFGLAAADKVNFLNLLAGTPLVLQSMGTDILGSGWAMLALWIAIAGTAIGAMMISARKMFVK